jgi:IS5 family transposase
MFVGRIIVDDGGPLSLSRRVLAQDRRQPRELRRRVAIEPVIGHLNAEHRMGRNYLAHHAGDAVNAVLAAAGYNFHLLLRWLELLLSRLLATQKAAAALQ